MTAPRTVAGRDRIFTLDEIHAFAKALSTRDAERAGKSATVAGRALVAASRTVHAKDGTVITVSDGDVLDAILAIEAEAIEPLLALVRAAQDYLVIEDETSPVEVTDFEAWWRGYEARVAGAVAATREALAALPESIRAAAK